MDTGSEPLARSRRVTSSVAPIRRVMIVYGRKTADGIACRAVHMRVNAHALAYCSLSIHFLLCIRMASFSLMNRKIQLITDLKNNSNSLQIHLSTRGMPKRIRYSLLNNLILVCYIYTIVNIGLISDIFKNRTC